MAALKVLIEIFLLLALVLLLLGLWRPVIALWWMDYQNRFRVLQLYGRAVLVLAVLWLLTGWLSH